MRPTIYKLSDIDLGKITYGNSIKLQNQIVTPLEYNGSGLFVQLPGLYFSSHTQNNQLILPLMASDDTTTNQIVKLLKEFDSHIISGLKQIVHDAKKLGNFSSKKFIYNAIVHKIENESGKSDNKFTNGALKLNLKNQMDKLDVLPEQKITLFVNKESIPIDKINDYTGSYVSSIVEFHSVVIDGSNICVYVRPHQLKIIKPKLVQYTLDAYSFIDSENEDTIEPTNKKIPISTMTEVLDNSSSEEEPAKLDNKSDKVLNELKSELGLFGNMSNIPSSFIQRMRNEPNTNKKIQLVDSSGISADNSDDEDDRESNDDSDDSAHSAHSTRSVNIDDIMKMKRLFA